MFAYNSTTSTSGTTATGEMLELGGTVPADAKASADAYAKLLAFLAR